MQPRPKIKFLPQNPEDVRAIQALAKGVASDGQQVRAFKCIVYELAGTYDMTFDPHSAVQTAFNEGKRAVGRALVGTVNFTEKNSG